MIPLDSQASPSPIALSFGCVFVYILRQSDVLGRLTSGSIQWNGARPTVFDSYGYPIPYSSGDRLKSWAIFRDGVLVLDLSHFEPEDLARLHARALG